MAVCFLTPIYTSSEKRPLISDHIKGPLVAVFRSPLMKALGRSVETWGLWIVTSSVTFVKSANQSSIKLCLSGGKLQIANLLMSMKIWVSAKERSFLFFFLSDLLCRRVKIHVDVVPFAWHNLLFHQYRLSSQTQCPPEWWLSVQWNQSGELY